MTPPKACTAYLRTLTCYYSLADAATSSTFTLFCQIPWLFATPVEKSVFDYTQTANFYSRKILPWGKPFLTGHCGTGWHGAGGPCA
jgi:hypothetical protein